MFASKVIWLPKQISSVSALSPARRQFASTMANRLSRPLPQGTWDSHMHVVDPGNYPLHQSAQYKPHPHTVEDMEAFYKPFGIRNMVFVQPSIYGNDNSCMLDALRQVTPERGRAVVTFDPTTIEQKTLQGWHELGVRGVRVNLVSVGREVSEHELRDELQQYAEAIKPFDWVLDLYIPLKLATTLEKIVPELRVKVCIDHFGSPSLPKTSQAFEKLDPYQLPGFESLVKLMQGNTWVKMSAPYRLSKDPDMKGLDSFGKELIKKASNRVIYATDWPFTRFENIDSIPFIEKCYEWCGNDNETIEKLFCRNAEELWDARKR